MPSLPEHLDVVSHGGSQLIDRLREAGSGHTLCAPVDVSGRLFVACVCGWVFSTDGLVDLPLRCDVERICFEAAESLASAERISGREVQELLGLLRRSAA